MSDVRLSGPDTIFALSSGAAPSAIAIVRISGPRAFDAVRSLAGALPKPRTASLRSLRTPETGDLLDRGLVLTFPGPDSATGEDIAELHLHGSRAVVRVIEVALGQIEGLRAAEPGEFTRRAFANGRIDLGQAEALSDLLFAETELQRRAAVGMMEGRFAQEVEKWRAAVLTLAASVEAALDFADEDDVEDQVDARLDELRRQTSALVGHLRKHLAQPPAERLRDGVRVALGGPPNSGKSSLLNAIVERDAAIVSDIAGTTRDLIEVPVALSGAPFLFIDTAGVRELGSDRIEAIGIERAHAAFARADLVLWLGGEGEGPNHESLIEIDAKADLTERPDKSDVAIAVSAVTGDGIDALLETLTSRARHMLPPADGFAINRRQRDAMGDAAEALAMLALEDDPLLVAEHLRTARLAFDRLSGRAHTEDMLDTLFGRFCIGK